MAMGRSSGIRLVISFRMCSLHMLLKAFFMPLGTTMVGVYVEAVHSTYLYIRPIAAVCANPKCRSPNISMIRSLCMSSVALVAMCLWVDPAMRGLTLPPSLELAVAAPLRCSWCMSSWVLPSVHSRMACVYRVNRCSLLLMLARCS